MLEEQHVKKQMAQRRADRVLQPPPQFYCKGNLQYTRSNYRLCSLTAGSKLLPFPLTSALAFNTEYCSTTNMYKWWCM